jgi:YVTN family beta-propeller protein
MKKLLLILALLPGLSFAGEDDHGLSDQLSAEAQALAPAFAAPAPAATVATARISLGEWGNVIPWTPHIPVTAATLPDGRLLTFSSNQRTTFPVGNEFTFAAVWNPRTGSFTEINNPRHDMFCGGTAMLQDGRVVINGGRNTTRLSSIFDWRTNQWSALPNMNDPRWYNTSVALVDSSVFTVSGDGGTNTAERWSQTNGWQRLPGIPWESIVAQPGYVTRWHPLILLAPDGRLFHGGPTRQMHWLTTGGNGTLAYSGVDVPGALFPKEGCFAMFNEGQILVAGGSTNTTPNPSDASTGTSSTAAFTIDIRSGTPVVTMTQSMRFRRQFCNSVILPNGEVMVIGGNSSGLKFNDTGSILTPEIWNPTTRQWRDVSPMATPRNYHSLALLLPDGRIWSGGGGLSGNSADHRDAEIFTPPQLFTSTGALAIRPTITAAPPAIGSGQIFEVQASPDVTRFTFIKMSSQTHSVNTDLRFLELPFTSPSTGTYSLTARANLNVMTPGYWMLFAHNAAGVYSEARVIQVSADNSPLLTAPGPQANRTGFPASLQLIGTSLGTLTYSATGLPTGLTINPATGLISGTITAEPGVFNPTITLTNSFNLTSTQSFVWTVTPPTAGSGTIRREVWTGVTGTNVSNLTSLPAYPNSPSSSSQLPTFEAPVNQADNYGQRIRGWLHPLVSGQYRLAIAGDDEAQLRLSTTDKPANAVLIARVPSGLYADSRQWNKYPEQTSAFVTLVAGQRYYIEALHKEGIGGDNLAVGWQVPGSTTTTVIDSPHLSPWTPNTAPSLTTPGPLTSVAGLATSLQLAATDLENDALTFSSTPLPPGLSLNPASGLISGIPTTGGAFPITTSVTDGVTPPVSVAFTWTINTALVLNTPASTAALVNSPVTFTATSSGGLNPRYRWSFGDGSPTTAFSTSPTTTYTYTIPGRYNVTLEASDDTSTTRSTSFFQVIHAPLTTRKPVASSSIVFEDRATAVDRVWVVNPDNDSVSVFDAVTRARLAERAVGSAPRSIAIAPDGRAWITNTESATITILNGSTYAVAATLTLPRGSRPFGIAFDPLGSAAFVALEGSGQLLKLNPATGAQISALNVGQNARQISIDAASSRLYLSRFITPPLPGENTASIDTTDRGGEILVVNATALTLERTVILSHSERPDSPSSARGIPNYLGATAISPDGLSAWVPSKQDNIKRGTLRNAIGLNHDQTQRAIASRLNLTSQIEDTAARLDFDNSGMPSAALFDPTGGYLFVALEASRAVGVVDASNREVIARFNVGRAPQGLALSPDGRTLFVHNFMDRSISVHDVSSYLSGGTAAPTVIATLSTITTERLTPQILLGKQLFYDAADPRLALQEYISCASCHNDGGHDGRTWDFTGFGEGLRNTITLRGHANQGPLHWSGNFDEVHDFEGQIRGFAGGTGLMTDAQFNTSTRSQPLGDPKAGVSADLDALTAYVKSLTTESNSPFRSATGALTADAVAGEKIFRTQNCATCHSGENFTNSALNTFADIGTRKPASGQRLNAPLTGFDVPTLRGLWATAPYLHDGSAATLADAVRAHSGLNLPEPDLTQLVAYLNQIDSAPAVAPLPITVQLTSTAPATVSSSFAVTITFSLPVTGLTLSDFTVTGGTLASLSGSGTTYTLQLTPTDTVSLTLPANSAEDTATVGNLVSNTLSRSFTAPPSAPVLVGENIGFATVIPSSSFDATTSIYSLNGAGSDIFFAADGFRFDNVILNGDGEIRARVTSFSALNSWAKAGVMIRETNAPGSRHATAFITPIGSNNGFGMVARTTTNAATSYTGGPAHNIQPNNWVRLVRSGSTLTSFASANGTAWTQIGTTTLTGLPSQVLIGLATTSSDTSALATATFDNVQITGTAAVVAPAFTLSAAATTETGPFTVQIAASQPVTGLALSDFVITNATPSNFIGSGAQYSLTLTPQTPGPVTINLPAAAALNAAAVPSLASNTLSVSYVLPPAATTLQGQDIGAPRLAGSTTFAANTYTLSASGSDIFFTQDSFHFALVQLSGDGEIRARVTSQTNTNPWAKAGVMIRENLTSGSPHALMFTTPTAASNGFGFVSRPTAGAATSYTAGPALNAAPNNWVRLVRSGNTLSAFASPNGTAWTPVSTTSLANLPATVFVGLALTSTSADVLASATFDNVQVTGTAAVPAPTVSLSSSSPTESGPFTVSAAFSQPVTGLALNDFTVTNATASNLTGSGSNYTLTLSPTTAGSVTLALPVGSAQNSAAISNTASNTLSVSFVPPAATVLRATDVGGIVVPGSTQFNSTTGTYTLAGAGQDIFFTSDGFQFTTTQLVGDGEIRARVTSQTNTNPWAKAGVMIRETLVGSGRHATTFVTPANGFGMVARTTLGGATAYSGGPRLNTVPNNWVRLVRSGNTLTAFASANGTAWTQIGTTTLSGLASTVYVGLAVTSSSPFVLSTATFDNVQVVGNQSALPEGFTAPVESLTTVDADFNGNGVNDLVEYAIGANNRPDAGWSLSTQPDGSIDAHLIAPTLVTDITYSLESSTDLVKWTRLPMAPLTTPINADWQQLTWTNISALSGMNITRGLVRLAVAQTGGTSAASQPQTWQRHTLPAGTHAVGFAHLNAPLFAGPVLALASDTQLTIDPATPIDLPATTPCYLEIVDGEFAGHRIDLTTAQTGTLTANLTSPISTLTTFPPTLLGARITVRPHLTLGQAFATAKLTGGTSAATSDQVLLHTPTGWQTHWLLQTPNITRWVLTGDTTLQDKAATVIPPGSGLMIKINTTPVAFTLTGHVRTHPYRRLLLPGSNFLASPWPLDGTPAGWLLTAANGLTASTSPATSDQIQLWNGTGYTGYWHFGLGTTTRWTTIGDNTLTDLAPTLPLPAHSAFFLRAQPTTPTWTLSPPK